MAMLPVLGYDAGDYLSHWLELGNRADADKLPQVFYVNWFRRDADGGFLWPGFGENSRVLKWIVGRLEGELGARDTAVGLIPEEGALDIDGLDLTPSQLELALDVSTEELRAEVPLIEEWFAKLGPTVPAGLHGELAALRSRLS